MATSDNELSDNEWRDKYEQLVQVLQNEFQETVLKAQKQAEANAAGKFKSMNITDETPGIIRVGPL